MATASIFLGSVATPWALMMCPRYSKVCWANEHLERLKALVWFWLIDETLSANLVYQSDYEIGSTTPSDEAMAKIMTMVMAW